MAKSKGTTKVRASSNGATPTEETADALEALLTAGGWEPYGRAGDVRFFKKNAVRLSARSTAAPAQGGKTMIQL